ncbi:helix-turn-helix transcriptional regulator [Rhizobium sp. KVB221]|uniref:Helix-turn-helix transcriptional regulator n=1 Tax=Rhizobium setariae TaxID=2801340 RepID=A0A936YL95_9HYPH|nr:AraC family transcriptional regulator [Rhizobium setariae]MBL0372388.1 helix-turn-helix transcriptional regulator [Rhizobium setariae]
MQYFSTDHVPERDRMAVLHDFIGRHVARRQFSPLDGREMRIELAAMRLAKGAAIGTGRYSPLAGKRSRELIADGCEDYLLTIHDQDHDLSIEGKQPIKVRAGEMMLVSDAHLSEFWLPQTTVSVISLGRKQLSRLFPRIDSQPYYRVPTDTPGLGLLAGYANLLRQAPAHDDKAAGLVSNHLYELAALALSGVATGDTGRSERSIGAARLALAKQAISKRLHEPDLVIAAIAQTQAISPRYLQRLFETEGSTFSEYLRNCRLELALRRLEKSDPPRLAISAIAYECGFSDLSYFNRTFRSRYGMTPSDVRAAAIRKPR